MLNIVIMVIRFALGFKVNWGGAFESGEQHGFFIYIYHSPVGNIFQPSLLLGKSIERVGLSRLLREHRWNKTFKRKKNYTLQTIAFQVVSWLSSNGNYLLFYFLYLFFVSVSSPPVFHGRVFSSDPIPAPKEKINNPAHGEMISLPIWHTSCCCNWTGCQLHGTVPTTVFCLSSSSWALESWLHWFFNSPSTD